MKSLAAPMAWPQLLSAGGYLLLFVIVMRRRIADPRLRAWLWLVPVWLVFMFVYGILIETRVFGELIPLIVCATAVIVEEILLARMRVLLAPRPALAVIEPVGEMQEAA
jgi:branched-subunit amino acid ABC-type transport system permease component